MKKTHGFTVIEMILVFAIGAIIIVGGIIAVPSLLISQRDTTRKANVSKIITAIKNYQTNNSRGALPESNLKSIIYKYPDNIVNASSVKTWNGFINSFVDQDAMKDPSGADYNFNVLQCLDPKGEDKVDFGARCEYDAFGTTYNKEDYTNTTGGIINTIFIITGANCSGNLVVKNGNPRSVAVAQILEAGTVYCENT